MRINQKKPKLKKRYIVIVVAILLLIGVLIGYFTWYLPSQNNESVDDNIETNSFIDNSDAEQYMIERESDKEPTQNDSSGVDQSNLTGYITTKNIIDGKLQIRVQINQYLTSGTCSITIGNYSEQASVVANPSSSTCQGWDIPISLIPKGSQTITININSGEKSMALTDEVEI